MACIKLTKTNGSQSELITTLETIFENEFKAESNYSYFESDSFKSEFGDYVKGYEDGDPSFYGRVDENGEPKLSYDETAKKYYFVNEKKEKVFYPLVKRGLRATFNYKQIDKIVSRLALNYFNKSKLNFNNINFEEGEPLPNLKQYIKNEIITKINDLKTKGLKEKMAARLLEKSLEDLNEYVEKVDAFYKQIGIKRVDNVDEVGLDVTDETQKDPSFNKQSFQKDSKDSLTTNVKLKLSLLEDTEDLDPIWNEPGFINFNEAHSTLLNDITNQVAIEGEDIFELQRNDIKLLATKKPYLKQLLAYMNDFTEEDKNQFAQAFNLHRNNYLVSEVQTKFKDENNDVQKGFTHTVKQISESGSKASIVTSEWGNNFKNAFLQGNNILSTEGKQVLTAITTELIELKTKITQNLSPTEFQSYTNQYIALTRKLGIELTENGFGNFLDEGGKIAFNTNAQTDKLSTSISQTAIAVKKAITSFNKQRSDFKNPFDAESVFKNLAKAESLFLSEGSDASIYSNGKNQWLFSYPSYLSTRILQWQKNPELLRNWYNQSAYNKGSEIMKFLLALDLDQNRTYDENYVNDLMQERLNNFRLGIFNSFQEKDGEQKASTDLSFKDYFNDNVNKVLANTYSRTTTPADKGSDLQIKTGYFIDSFLGANDGKIDFTDKVKEVFFNYFNSEVNRMKEASAEVDALKFTPEKLNINYHFKEGSAIDAKDGNAFKSQYFPELSFSSDSKDSRVVKIKEQLYNKDGSIKHTSDVSANSLLKEDIKDYISDVLSEGVNESIFTFLQQEILQFDQDGLLTNKGLDSKVFNKYFEKNLLNPEEASIEAVSDFYINSLIQNVEYSKMFTGDVAFYKDMVDYKKRVPATYTDGLQLRLQKGEEHFTVATIDKVKVGSPFHDELVKLLGKKGAEPYSGTNINSADAQAWITPARWKFLTERLGKWTPDHTSLYQKMMSGKDEVYTAKELKIAAQPLKGVYFYMNGKVPTYFKYSQSVLTPAMTKSSEGLRTILDKMNEQGIDEVVTLDGFKVGSPTPTKIHNADNTVKKDITFNAIQLSNYGWKLQQDLPVKGFKQTAVGSQIQKNIFAGLIHNSELAGFELDGKETNGQTISNNIVDVVSGLVDKGIKDVKEEFNVFRNGQIKNSKGFYNALIRELEQRGGSQNTIDALNKNIALYGLPQSMDKLISVFSSIMNDRLIKIKTNGGSFVQMSNFGILKEEGDQKGVMWNPDVENNTGAYEPKFYTKENGRKSIRPAGILISGSFIAKYIPDYKKYTAEELFKGKDGNPPIIDKKILENLVGYRIPNQGLSSNDALEIIGILPEENGDTIVAYTGITTKTGSDFDIDKMYIMMPNYTLENDRLVYTNYDPSLPNKKQSKEALQNRLIELYKSVLTHPKVIKDVMKPLDNDILKDDINNLKPSETSGTMFHFNAYNDIKLRYEFINGKAGVGQEANAVVDVNRPGNLSINRYTLGWGHVNDKKHTKLDEEYSERLSEEDLNYYVKEFIKDGADKTRVNEFKEEISRMKISDSLTAILNAFVDIAKDPYITRGNWTTSTTNTGNLLIRAGVHPLYVTAFMAQPIIKEYIEYQASKESIVEKSSGDIKNKFKKNLVITNLEKLNENYPDLSKPLELLYQKFIKSGISGNVFNSTGAAEKLQKLLGKKNILNDQELNDLLKVLRNEHGKVFDAEKIRITDRTLYNLQHYRDQVKKEATSNFQIAVLDKFYELQEISKAVKQNVDISKLDTNGMGKNVNSLFSTFNLIQHVLDKEKSNEFGVLNGLQSKFENTTLAAYHKGLKEVMRIVQANPLLFPQAQSKVQEMFNEISADLYNTPAIDEELMTDLEKSYYTYVMSNFAPFNFSSEEARALLSNLPATYTKFKQDNKGKYFFLDELQIKNDLAGLRLIALNNRKKSDSFEKKFTDSWRDLYNDNPELAEDLIKYSFLTSGFKMNTNQFFTYIPHEYLLDNNINSFIVNFSKEEQTDFLDKFYLNNSSSYKYVSRVFDSDLESEDIISGFILKRPKEEQNTKARYYVSRSSSGGVYKLEGYDSYNRPVYTRVKPLGRKAQGVTVVEYGEPFTKSEFVVKPEYVSKLKNSVVTERNKYNPNFVLDKVEDREEDEDTELSVEELRQSEQTELLSAIPNIESYKVEGRIDKTLMPTPVLNKYNEIWNRYDKLITPLLQKESTQISVNKPKGEKVKDGIYVNQEALSKDEQLELFNMLQPYLEEQAAKTNKGTDASKMIGLGLRWDYKSNNPGKKAMDIPDVINPGNKNKYGYYDTSINNQPLAEITPRFRELMQKATGVDMTNYDGAIINLYEATSFISSHNDVDESKSAIGYPVIGINIGGTGNFSIESRDGSPKQLDLKAGTGYVFGVDGVNREVYHRTFAKPQDSFLPELTTKLDGKTYEPGSYRITITMRRVMPLEKGMSAKPLMISDKGSVKTAQPSTNVKEGTLLNKVGDTIVQSSKTKYKIVNLNGVIEDITETENGYNVILRFKTYNGSKTEKVIIENGNVIKTVYKSPLKMGEFIESEKSSYNFEFSKQSTQPSTNTEVATEPITSMSEITNHSGGAYGADTFWDQIGREFGVTKHMHYRESANSNLSQKLRNAKVEATVITKEELEAARTEVEKLLGIKFSDTLEGNLQVRNYYQVANSDGVFAIARLSKDFMNAEVFGGTNTAVQLGQKLNKPVYVWDTETEQWYKAENKKWVKTETPILTKNFAGVGSRDIESYSVKDKETGNWKPRKEYLGTAKENAAKQAIKDVYQKTKDSISNEGGATATEEVAQPVSTELTPGQYVKYNDETYIVTKQNANGTFQILNPNLQGAASKISVAKNKLQAIGRQAKLITYKGAEYLVTPNGTIISTVTNKAMNWAENDGNRLAILELANNNITAPNSIKIYDESDNLEESGVFKKDINVVSNVFKPANKEQEVAIEAIKDFINNGNPKEIFTLEGKAGTGKTTLVQEALADSVAKGKRIHIAALSHKAKLVLAQKLNQRFPGRIGSSSVAGLLGMKMNEETGEFEQGYSPERPIERAEIIVIDEASMINEEALELIMLEKRYNAKVIFLGDRGQLPPIRKLSTDQISAVFESPNKASLTERVRQGEESPILPFADNFWDNSESANPKSNPVPEDQIKDTLTDKGNLVFINSLFDVFGDVVNTFKKGIDSRNFNVIKIVTYKNATRQNYNKEIRKAIFGEDVPQFVEKDQIMFQNNYVTPDRIEFSNSDEFSVMSVTPSQNNGYKVFELGVKVDPDKNVISYFPVLAEEEKSRFNSEVSELFEIAKRMAPGQSRKIAYQKAWALKGMFAEIDYSYAITSHKSQGSTYDNVIVDLKDIYSVGATSNASKSRSAYTGLTRAKNTAIVITSKATTNNSNVKKSLSVVPTLSEAEQQKAEELKKYCNPS